MHVTKTLHVLRVVLLGVLAGVLAPAQAQSPPRVDDSATTKELANLPRSTKPKQVVAIYDFRSGVPEVQAGAGRDMFVTALIKSGAFAVAERTRLSEGVMRERQLSQSGITASGPAGQIAAARYIFEVAVTEANAGASTNSNGVTVAGMQVSGGNSTDTIGMDVRIVDAQTGLVVDAINVEKTLESSNSAISGVGGLLSKVTSMAGRTLPVDVDAQHQSSHKEGVDRAVRACMEAAVAALVKRLAD